MMLNNIGASTLPCGSPFRFLRHRLFFPFSTTKKRLLSSMVRIWSVRCTSPVISSTLLRRRRWLIVSYAADKSTKTAPVIRRFSWLDKMCHFTTRGVRVREFTDDVISRVHLHLCLLDVRFIAPSSVKVDSQIHSCFCV